jgi:hypothetical protein
MYNHESHFTLDVHSLCKETGITQTTFSPHCFHRLQPLDVGVMGPIKGKLRVAQHDGMTVNPGKVTTIHDLASLTNVAYQTPFIAKNIMSNFAKPGVRLFSRIAFGDEDFGP